MEGVPFAARWPPSRRNLSALMPFLYNVYLDTGLPAGELAKHGLEAGGMNLSSFQCFSWTFVSVTRSRIDPPSVTQIIEVGSVPC